MLNDLIAFKSNRWHAAGESFPAGPLGKRQAIRAAIRATRPDIHDQAALLSAAFPKIEERAWKAAVMVAEGEIWLISSPDAVAQAMGNEFGDYFVTAVDYRLACSCEDFQRGTTPRIEGDQRMCKHTIAVGMLTGRIDQWTAYYRHTHAGELVG